MTDNPSITIVTDSFLLSHDTGGGEHPEVPERLQAVDRQLQSGPLASSLNYVQHEPAPREWLLSFHTEAWLFRFEESVLSGRTYMDHPDNQICYESYDVAISSAGTGLTGVDLIEKDGFGPVFCSTRPPGHHAEPNMPFGFCFLNNCVIAARYWQKKYKRQRVCIIDFDAHHGNGIQTAFEEDADSLYISIHEHPSFSYPGTGYAEEKGMEAGIGTILNIPLLPGASDRKFFEAWDREINEKLNQFKPEVIIIAAGFDGHEQDDMSGLNYTTQLYGELGRKIGLLAEKFTQGRLLSILEGGYHIPSLAESVEEYLTGLQTVTK